jgi:thiaminase/transcriptional activator TenA
VNARAVIEDETTLFGRLRSGCAKEWKAYCEHPFVLAIANGTLPQPCFKEYLVQDYVFLIHYARAWALAAFKSDDLAEMRGAVAIVDGILNHEMSLHVEFCRGWGLGLDEMEAVEEAPGNMAYTRYVLERGLAGDVLDLHVALAPCALGYAEIGMRLADRLDPGTNNPYREWIAMYSGEEYLSLTARAVEALDRLAARRLCAGRFDSLQKTFRQATLLEIGFWDLGLAPAQA